MTGYAPELSLTGGLVDGRFPVLYKPVTEKDLLNRVRQLLPATAEKKPTRSPQSVKS